MPKFLVAATLLAAAAQAHALNVVESTDFPGTSAFGPEALSIGTLDSGANSVMGQLNGNCIANGDCNPSVGGGDSQDSFVFTVAAGTTLTSLVVSTNGVTGPAGFGTSLQLRSPLNEVVFEPYIPLNDISGNLLSGAVPAGIYSLTVYGQSALAAGAYHVGYSLALGVTPVPEAPAALMLALGLGALAVAHRQRRAHGTHGTHRTPKTHCMRRAGPAAQA